MIDGEVRARVDALRRAGRYEEAAAILLAAGEPGLASELLATIWKFDRAIQIAEERGHPSPRVPTRTRRHRTGRRSHAF